MKTLIIIIVFLLPLCIMYMYGSVCSQVVPHSILKCSFMSIILINDDIKNVSYFSVFFSVL